MGIDHTCGSKLTLTIHHLSGLKASRYFLAHIGNLFILNSDILQFPVRSMQ